MKTEVSENTVQDKCHPGHVTSILQDGYEGKQDKKDRHVIQHGDSSVYYPYGHGTKKGVKNESLGRKKRSNNISKPGKKRPCVFSDLVTLDYGELIHKIDSDSQDNRAKIAAASDLIDPVCQCFSCFLFAGHTCFNDSLGSPMPCNGNNLLRRTLLTAYKRISFLFY